jgi:hypothetical protein
MGCDGTLSRRAAQAFLADFFILSALATYGTKLQSNHILKMEQSIQGIF